MSVDLPLRTLRPAAAELPLNRAEVLRYLRYRPGVTRLQERHQRLVDEGIRLALGAAVPVARLGYCAVAVEGHRVATRLPALAWESRSLAGLMKEAAAVTVVAATLGPRLEELTAHLFRTEEYALATVVDAAGSALVQGFGRWIASALEREAGGLHPTPLYGPGYGDWALEEQAALLAATGAQVIGLTATAAHCLVPQKSLAGLIGWTGEPVTRRGCSLCALADCPYRWRQA